MSDEKIEIHLARIDERLVAICRKLDKAASAEGFTRCATNRSDINGLQKTVVWIRNTFVGFVMGLAVWIAKDLIK